MNKSLSALLLTAGFVGPAFPAELTLDVMTFNIRFGIAYDRENNWPNRQEMTVDMLREYRPAIIGTQEMLPFQADYITRWLPEYRWFGAPRSNGPLPERSAIMYDEEILLVLESGTFWLSETPDKFATRAWDASQERIATWARFHHLESGRDILVYNTHFDHVGPESRRNSMTVILDHIAKQDPELPLILTGDFNVTAEKDPVYTKAIEAGLKDAWVEAKERVGPVTTWNAFQPLNENSDRRIDWILFRGDWEVERCETIAYQREGRWVSDHFPVQARMTLPAVEE